MAIATGTALALGAVALGAGANAYGSYKASQQQAEATQAGIESQERLSREGLAQLEPYRQAGETTLGGLSAMVNDPTQAMQNIAQSQQFQDQLGLASENAMRYRSATGAGGGLQSSGTSNQLAFLAPQLQNQMYQQQLQNRMGLAGLGMGAAQQGAQQLGALGGSQLMANQAIGQAQAAGTMGVTNAVVGGLSDVASLGLGGGTI